ncbi:glycosyltransferase [Sandaracinomonas limnophila]|uniref:Glycosyltransferase n=1 Tax=Sandaracinomonas limnophila TaxID=1862386 RepID=A0A437PWU6_9BACT|nr:glycosyltransferase [Sandaracinomonas limnophila]RVU26710.1 glycosyltransferase [Sandaracinomonas limnophila]
MKVLIFHNTLSAQYKSIYFEKIFQNLKNSGGDLFVVQTSYSEAYRFNHFDKLSLENSIKYPYFLISKKPLEKVNQLFEFYFWLKYIITFKPDILNLTGYTSIFTLPTLLICKFLKIKTIITLESITTSKNLDSIKAIIKKIILKNVDYINSYGLKTNNYLFSMCVPKTKIINFSNTFDKNKFNNISDLKVKNQTIKLLFIGRLSEEKNLINTIKFLSKIKKNNLEFDIYGDGPLQEKIKLLIQKNNLQFVKLMGPIKWNEVSNIYPKYDYLILLSNSETWGMVANEALFFNIPVICSENCGCADDLVISNQNGLILGDLENQNTIIQLENYLNKPLNSINFIQRNNLIFDEKFAINNFLEKLYLLNEK